MKKQNAFSPPKKIIAGKFSRRRFLTAAGMTAVALPFIKPGSVLGDDNSQTCPYTDENHIPSPNPWMIRGCNEDTVGCYNDSNIVVTGTRHYCTKTPKDEPNVIANFKPPTYPTRYDDASVCFTIYPEPSDLLGGGWDDTLNNVIFPNAQELDMMSCWHELGGVNSNFNISGTTALQMQQYILDLRTTYNSNHPKDPTKLAFGAIECGNAKTSPGHLGGWEYVQTWMGPNLDFYGNDLYEAQYGDAFCALNDWYIGAVASGYSPKATIAVTECNSTEDGHRACYFANAANWVWNQPNSGVRSFLCFWGGSGVLGGPWSSAGSDTITELQHIGSGNYAIPSTCSPSGCTPID